MFFFQKVVRDMNFAKKNNNLLQFRQLFLIV